MEIRKELNLKKPSFLQQGRVGHSSCGELILKESEKFNCLSVYSLGKSFAQWLFK